MAKKYLDSDGLLYVWNKIKATFALKSHTHTASEAPGSVTGVKGNSESSYRTGNVNLTAANIGAAPTSHASTATTYGSGTSSNYGHVKLSDATDGTAAAASGGTAATPKAVSDALTAAKNYADNLDTGVSGVKGDAESTYRTGDVNITKANIGLENVDNTADANKTVASADKITTQRIIDGVYFDGTKSIVHYGTCATAANTGTKIVSLPNDTWGWTTGAWIAVKFTVTNTAAVSNLMLSVNSSTPKPIKYRGANLPANGLLAAGRVYLFVYDGTNFELVGDLFHVTNLTQAVATAGTSTTNSLISAKVLHDSIVELLPDDVTTSEHGLMSAADKTKLDGIATGAEVNQNAFSNIKVGNTIIAADTKTDTFELAAGPNITLTPSAASDTVTIDVDDDMYSDFTGPIGSVTGTHGLVPAPASGEQNAMLFGDGTWEFLAIEQQLATRAISVKVYKGSNTQANEITNFVLDAATTSNIGLMTAADKTKLDSLTITNGVIDASNLPSYVDDVIEAYPRSGQTELSSTWLAAGSASGTVITPEAGKIYVLMADTTSYATNTQFRWGGTAYVKLADGGVSSITNAEIDAICV